MNTRSIFLLDDTLIANVGADAAIFLARVKYWSERCGKRIKGEAGLWIYNTLEEWHEQFHFWSKSKLKRIIKLLEDKGVLLSKRVNAKWWNQTKWYCVNFEAFCEPEEVENKNPREKNYQGFENSLGHDQKQSQAYSHKTQTSTKTFTSPKKKHTIEHLSSVETSHNFDTNRRESFKKQKSRISGFSSETSNDLPKKLIQIWNKEIPAKNKREELPESRYFDLLQVYGGHNFRSDIERWKKFAEYVTHSKFLMGKVNDFRITLGWAIEHKNLHNILKGKYHLFERDSEKAARKTTKLTTPLEELESIKPEKWRNTLKDAILEIGEDIYVSLFSKLKFDKLQGGILKLKTTSPIVKDLIERSYRHHKRALLEIAKRYFGDIDFLEIKAQEETQEQFEARLKKYLRQDKNSTQEALR